MIVVAIASVVFLIAVLVDGFETLVLPRRVASRLRFARLYYRSVWPLWRRIAGGVPATGRDTFLSVFGPLSLLVLLSLWATGLIVGFALLHWALGSKVSAPEETITLGTYLYFSATTFITLGFGDVAPRDGLGRFITDVEAGLGFGFLAIVIGYVPVLYSAFSRREIEIALLDARASSPPAAGELLRRYAGAKSLNALDPLLRDWERWCAELLESHLSYPVLTFYRSQHDRQSWLSTLTVILDTCSLILAGLEEREDAPIWQARLTFAMARHAAVDIALVFETPPRLPDPDRLSPDSLAELRRLLEGAGVGLTGAGADARLLELRRLYEPFVNALSRTLLLALPAWLPDPDGIDNWQTSAWDRADHFFQTGPASAPHTKKIDDFV